MLSEKILIWNVFDEYVSIRIVKVIVEQSCNILDLICGYGPEP